MRKMHCHRCNDNGWLAHVNANGFQIMENGKPKLSRCQCMYLEDEARRLRELAMFDNLLPVERKTVFGNLVLVEDQKNLVRVIENNPKGMYVLSGSPGTGKTTTLVASVNFAVMLGYPAIYVTMKRVLDEIRQSYGNDGKTGELTASDIWRRITGARVLCLDEFSFDSQTPWAINEIEALIDDRWRRRHDSLTLVSSNLTEGDVRHYSPRIASRLFVDVGVSQINLGTVDLRGYVS